MSKVAAEAGLAGVLDLAAGDGISEQRFEQCVVRANESYGLLVDIVARIPFRCQKKRT